MDCEFGMRIEEGKFWGRQPIVTHHGAGGFGVDHSFHMYGMAWEHFFYVCYAPVDLELVNLV